MLVEWSLTPEEILINDIHFKPSILLKTYPRDRFEADYSMAKCPHVTIPISGSFEADCKIYHSLEYFDKILEESGDFDPNISFDKTRKYKVKLGREDNKVGIWQWLQNGSSPSINGSTHYASFSLDPMIPLIYSSGAKKYRNIKVKKSNSNFGFNNYSKAYKPYFDTTFRELQTQLKAQNGTGQIRLFNEKDLESLRAKSDVAIKPSETDIIVIPIYDKKAQTALRDYVKNHSDGCRSEIPTNYGNFSHSDSEILLVFPKTFTYETFLFQNTFNCFIKDCNPQCNSKPLRQLCGPRDDIPKCTNKLSNCFNNKDLKERVNCPALKAFNLRVESTNLAPYCRSGALPFTKLSWTQIANNIQMLLNELKKTANYDPDTHVTDNSEQTIAMLKNDWSQMSTSRAIGVGCKNEMFGPAVYQDALYIYSYNCNDFTNANFIENVDKISEVVTNIIDYADIALFLEFPEKQLSLIDQKYIYVPTAPSNSRIGEEGERGDFLGNLLVIGPEVHLINSCVIYLKCRFERTEDRAFIVAHLQWRSTEFYFVGGHLEAYDATLRQWQCEAILFQINSLNPHLPVVLAGDMNDIHQKYFNNCYNFPKPDKQRQQHREQQQQPQQQPQQQHQQQQQQQQQQFSGPMKRERRLYKKQVTGDASSIVHRAKRARIQHGGDKGVVYADLILFIRGRLFKIKDAHQGIVDKFIEDRFIDLNLLNPPNSTVRKTFWGLHNIDYILLRNGTSASLKPMAFGAIENYYSDHFPIYAVFHEIVLNS